MDVKTNLRNRSMSLLDEGKRLIHLKETNTCHNLEILFLNTNTLPQVPYMVIGSGIC
jgi:hypothetical protein